jgi:hypothetical protein
MSDEKIQPAFHPSLLGKTALSPHDDDACSAWPLLMGLLLPTFDAKARLTREAGILSIRIDGSVFRVTLVCPTEGVQSTYETPTLIDLFSLLNDHLSRPTTIWVPTYDSKKRAGQALKRVVES